MTSGRGFSEDQELKMPLCLPQDRREVALVHFGMIRGYWRLAEAASFGRVDDDTRREIEADAIESLSGAAEAADEFGPTREGTVDAARRTLHRIFVGANCDRR